MNSEPTFADGCCNWPLFKIDGDYYGEKMDCCVLRGDRCNFNGDAKLGDESVMVELAMACSFSMLLILSFFRW